MPKPTAGSKTRDMSQEAALMRNGTPWGRVKALARYVIQGVTPDTWMSPNQPVDPVAQEAWGRNRDYRVGYNLNYTPRAEEATSFQQLRALAENCDVLRIAIENRKDQVCAMAWSIGHTDPEKDKGNDPRLQQIEQLFKRPDGILDWQAWLRQLLEDMLVIDAPTILTRRTLGGQVLGFEVIDGAMIKPLVNADGRMPAPPSPAYQQNIKGLPTVDYTADELLYIPRNVRSHKFYGYSPVEQIMMTINIAIRRSLSQLQYYTEGNIPAAFVNVPANWNPQQIREFQEYWDSVIEGDQAQKRKVRFVPEGTKPATLNEPPLKDDFDEWIARVVCAAFTQAPTPFVKQMNRATSETQKETSQDEGVAPTKLWVKRVIDFLIQVRLGFGDLEFKWVEEEENDPNVQMIVLTGYQAKANMSINEVREKLGLDPISDPAGNMYLIYTATGAMTLDQVVNPPEPPPMLGLPGANDEPDNPGGNPPPRPKGKPKPKQDDEVQKAGHSHLHKADTSELTAPMVKLRDVFAQALQVVRDEAVKKAASLGKASNTDDRGGFQRDAEDYAYWEGFAESMDAGGLSLAYDDFTDTLQAVSASGAREEVGRIVTDDAAFQPAATGAGFDLLNHQDPNAIEWARGHAADMLTSDGHGGKLVDATRDMVRQLIENALEEKVSDKEIARRLQDAYAFSEQRAELIARTEVKNALGAGGLQGAIAVGMQEKSWLLSNDENKCKLCVANAKQGWIPISQSYVSGAMAPGQHPRCQCDQAYRKRPKEE